jgi:hypothetical protein
MTNQPSPPDDLKAIRSILETLKDFTREDQQRILRWTQEKLNLVLTPTGAQQAAPSSSVPEGHREAPKDIKSFVLQKKPQSDIEFAATVAYYFRFEAPEDERKNEISTDDLQDAARKVPWEQKKKPGDTLHNAFKGGLLDKGGSRGSYKINTVGENLVAMTLPFGGHDKPGRKKPRTKNRARTKSSRKRQG